MVAILAMMLIDSGEMAMTWLAGRGSPILQPVDT